MFSDGKEEMDQKQLNDLLYTVYKLTMDHYPEGPQSCRHIFKTLKAVVDSAVSDDLSSALSTSRI